MSASEWAAVAAAQVCLVLLVVLVVVLGRVDRAGRELRRAVVEFRRDAQAALEELRTAVRDADYELDRIDAIVSGAHSVTERVDAASALAYRTLTSPVVKVLAAGSGTKRAVQRLRGDAAGAGDPARRSRRARKRAS